MRDDETTLQHARADVVRRYGDRLPDVAERFDAIVAEFDGAPVRTFVPVLAERRLRRLLDA